jgi:Protein of unknown function (DUF3071)
MRTARLVGLSPDGRSLIVATEDGEEFAIVADDRLRAALRGDRPRLGQLEIEMKTSLSPRDIQARIRAGESLEDVGELAGIPLDRLERFAAPVLAEREHIAAVAMSSSVRRRGEASGHRTLRITVTERLVSRGVDIDTVIWDSHRLDDGRWAVTADYVSGDARRHALFAFDPRSRFSVAGNDEARWLLGEQSVSYPHSPIGRRPGDVTTQFPGDTEPTVDLGDELALVRATREPVAPQPPVTDALEEPTVTVPRLLRPVADLPPQLGGDGYSEDSPRVYPGLSDATAVPETGLAAGWEPAIVVNYPVEPSLQVETDSQRFGEPTPEAPVTDPGRPAEVPLTGEPPAEIGSPTAPGTVPEVEPELPGTDTPGPPDATVNLADRMDEAEEFETESMARAAVGADRRPRRKRATVPSWDEIMFGGPKRSR